MYVVVWCVGVQLTAHQITDAYRSGARTAVDYVTLLMHQGAHISRLLATDVKVSTLTASATRSCGGLSV
jgi:uncharacterized membrane protein YadS